MGIGDLPFRDEMTSRRALWLLLVAACGRAELERAPGVILAPAVETTINEDGSVTVSIPGDASTMSFAVTTQPSHGVITGSGPDFLYTPGVDFVGRDSLRITVTQLASKQATIIPIFIGIEAVNDPPVAHDDQFTTAEDTDLVLATSAVLANDSDVDSVLTVVGVMQPDDVQVTLDGDTITYHPYRDFNGTQTFAYSVSDGQSFATAMITVRVTSVNDAPVAFDLIASNEQEDRPYRLAAADFHRYGYDPDGDTMFFAGVGNPSHGSVAVVDDLVVFTPDPSYVGPAGYEFTLGDGQLSATGRVSIYFEHVNHPPEAVDDSILVAAGVPSVLDPAAFVANDRDPDGDVLQFAGVDLTSPRHGSLDDSDGGLSYVPEPGYAGADSFTYVVGDGTASAVGTVAVTVVE